MYKRNGTIDMMRVVFSIIIVFLHATQNFLSGIEIFRIGSLGVDFFFIVSGFLMAQSSLKYSGKSIGKETWDFLIRKISGFLPEVVIAWFIAFVVTEMGRENVNAGDLEYGISWYEWFEREIGYQWRNMVLIGYDTGYADTVSFIAQVQGDLFGHHSTIGHGYDVGVSMSHVQYSPFTKRMGRVLL